MSSLDAGRFYAEYHGHPLDQLDLVHSKLSAGADTTIFLAGDSSLDNKHWFFESFSTKEEQIKRRKVPDFMGDAVNGFETILKPPRMVKDVAYWMNLRAAERFGHDKVVTINASVEESTVGERLELLQSGGPGLLPHDIFIRDRLATSDDVLVLSLGGNDVALKPTTLTIASVFVLTRMPTWLIRTMGRWTPGFGHLEWLFHDSIQGIIQRIVAGSSPTPPRKVVACMIYYLDEKPGGSWADNVLSRLGYDADPSKLQLIIRLLFERLRERGFDASNGGATEVAPFPLFEVLDGKDTQDYVQRVEPSIQGGEKMASALLDFIFQLRAPELKSETK